MIIKQLNKWEELEEELLKIRGTGISPRNPNVPDYSGILFRGQGDNGWNLSTTLERNINMFATLVHYYRIVAMAKPQIESYTGEIWDVMEYDKYEEWLKSHDTIYPGDFPAYDFFVYLRHHAFPSPLLDWTRSPYVAAYFAFSNPPDKADFVSIYAYLVSVHKSPKLAARWPGKRATGQ